MEDDSRLIELFRLGDSNVNEQLAREIKRKNNYQTLHTLLDETISRSTLLTSKITALENERLEGQLRILRLITQLFPVVQIKQGCYRQVSEHNGTGYVRLIFQMEFVCVPLDECKLVPLTTTSLKEIPYVDIPFTVEEISLPNIILKKVFDKPIYQGEFGVQINGNSLSRSIDIHDYLKFIKIQYGINLNLDAFNNLDPIPF